MSKKLILPVSFDEDFDLVDGEGAPLLWGADMIDHNPDIGREIEKRVNSHERLVDLVIELMSCGLCYQLEDFDNCVQEARDLLAELEPGHAQE